MTAQLPSMASALTGLLSLAALPAVKSITAPDVLRSALSTIREAASVPQLFTLAGGLTLFPREYSWPLPDGFEWPKLEFFAFYEHSGAFREAWPSLACSVANRPTDVAPSNGKYHFCMDVHLFLSVYPYPIGTCTTGVTCTYSTWANHSNWREHVKSGKIKEKAEEFLFMLYIGARTAGEHPPSCFEAVIGPPSFITTYFEHGPPDDAHPTTSKTVEWYTRNLDKVPPSHIVPDHLRLPRPSHANRDVSMVIRSTMPASFARAHAAVWAKDAQASFSDGRPAWQVAPGYGAHRLLMHSNYAAFASQFAPMVTEATLRAEDRPPFLVAVPIGMGDECCALIPLRHAGFAQPLQQGVPLPEQMRGLCSFLPEHEEPQLMHITRDSHGDVIFAVPYIERVVGAVDRIPTDPPRNVKAVWVTYGALSKGQFEHTALAMERRQSFVEPVPWMRARVGVTQGPVPVTPHRASAMYRSGSNPRADVQWSEWLEEERSHVDVLYAAFEEADGGTGILDAFVGNIHTAFTRAHELQPPEQGLPRLDPAHYAMMPYPDAPMPLHTSYLARVPPQQLPEGFPETLRWVEVLRTWTRRMLVRAIGMNAEHDFECYDAGWSDKPRHPFLCIGPGGFHNFSFTDGVGDIPYNQFLLRVHPDGLLRPMHFEHFDHKDLEVVIGQMGFSTDKELLSFLIHGARWKVVWPRQLRVSHSVFSLKTRARGVGEATAKLVEAGLYIAELLITRGETLSEDVPCTATLPQYSTGMGGADKTDKPEKRPCGNTSDPHDVVYERNQPHGPPDGPRALSVNDMTGLKTYPPGFKGYIPFPDPETKSTTREVYAAECVIGAMAAVNGTKPGASKDDVKWMFFQLNTEPCEFWIQVQYLIMARCRACNKFEKSCTCLVGQRLIALSLYKVTPRVTNMGTRPSSKVAVRFSKEVNVEWRARMADHVQSVWLPRQSQALRDLLAERERVLGYDQAHPFCCFEFTDDFLDLTPETNLVAVGARTRRQMAKEMNLWMSSKAEAGTCIDYIGGRHLITGGFGTLAPHKRARCFELCGAALEDQLDLDEFGAHNSFLVHVRDILDFDVALLEGNWAPLRALRLGWATVRLSEERFQRVRQNFKLIQREVATRPAASFATGFFDAPRGAAPSPGTRPTMYLHMASDCRADGTTMCIFGALTEYEWRICLSDLDPRWARRHINVGESTGAAVNVAVFGVPFGMFELIQGGDNRAEGPMLLGKAKASDQRVVGDSMRETAGYKACSARLWFEHNSGVGLGFTDAGSRDLHSVLDNLAAAFGRRRTRIDATAVPGVLELLSKVLEGTTDYVKPPRVLHGRHVHIAPSAADLRQRLREEVGDGLCPSAERHNSASQVQSLSPTPPRRLPASPPPMAAGSAAPPPPLTPSPARPLRLTGNPPSPVAGTTLSPTPPRASSGASRRTAPRTAAGALIELTVCDTDDHSPQPLTAAAARAAAALESADMLIATSSTAAAHSATARELRALCSAAHHCEVGGIPRGTRSHDEWGFKKVRRFAERFGFQWMRPRHVAPEHHHLESRFVALALYHIVPEMAPAPRTLAKGIDQAKPPSGMLALYGWRRVMRDCGRHVPDMHAASRMLRGMIEQLKARCGQDAMSVDHHIPYPLQSIVRAVAYLDNHSNSEWTPAFHDSLAVVVRFSLARGPRMDEWCEMFAGDTYYRRVNFTWCLVGDVIGSTAAMDAAGGLSPRLLLRATNVPSKTDRSGAKWIGKHMWYRPSGSDPLNFASAWARFERRYPCTEGDRRTWAAFSPSGGPAAFKPTQARAALHSVWVVIENEAFAAMHTWHDFRATLATALAAADKSHAFIQAAVCWASPASVALYGQQKPEAMADAADLATSIDASRHAHIATPHVCDDTVVDELEVCMAHLSAEPDGHAPTTASAKRAGAPPKAKPAKKKKATPAPTVLAPTPAPSEAPPKAKPAKKKATPAPTVRAPTPAPSTSTSTETYDVGAPLGRVHIEHEHQLDGARV